MPRLRCIGVLLLALAFSAGLSAQSSDATLSGMVADSAGKAITHARVDVRNEATGVGYSTETNAAGIYTLPVLPPGEYVVQVFRPGFKTVLKPHVVLNVESAVALNFTLPVGPASESITVEAAGILLNTTDGAVATVIDRKFVENTPLNGRSFQDLIAMTPGIATQSPQSNSTAGFNGDFTVDGQRTESNSYIVDGVSANAGAGTGTGGPQAASSGAVAASTALGTSQSLLSVDALDEFRVESSSYSAEFGRTPGGQFLIASRAGTSQVHGSLYDYLRNDALDASDWFNGYYGARKPALRQNDFGGTLGGPVRLPGHPPLSHPGFYFFSYEGLRLTQPQAASLAYVPDAAMRAQAPDALKPVLDAFPVANGVDYGSESSPSLAAFSRAYSLPSSIDATSLRVDEQAASWFSLFFRYGNSPSQTKNRTLSNLTAFRTGGSSYTLGIDNPIGHAFTHLLRAGYTRTSAVQATTLDDFGGAQSTDLATDFGIGGIPNAYPDAYLYFGGVGSAEIYTSTNVNDGRQWNLVDTMALSLGHHFLKWGWDIRDIHSPLNPASPNVTAYYFSPDSVLANVADYLGVYKNLSATPVFHQYAAFLNDTWQPTRRLSLNLGLRWEANPPPTEASGHDAYTVTGKINAPATLALAPQGTPLWRTPWFNFAPRLGGAWQILPRPNFETVLRGGAGMFFDTGTQYAAQGYLGVGFGAYQLLEGAPLPAASSALDFSVSAEPPYTSASVFTYAPDLELPFTLEWNVSLEQALGRSQTFTASYVGSNGRRLLEEQDHYVAALNPDFNFVSYTENATTSNYQALQAVFQRSVRQGLEALASYTWSHALDYGSTYGALPETRGNADFDLRNNFTGGLSWDLPAPAKAGKWALLFGGTGLDAHLIARAAFPVTLLGNFLNDPATGNSYYSNVDRVAGEPVYLYASAYPGGKAINPAAFALPDPSSAGNAPRNFVRAFGATQINLALRRKIQLRRIALQLRIEAFNLANHPNFGYVDPDLGDPTFGTALKTLSQSLGTVSAQYQQGGPRSLQAALHITF